MKKREMVAITGGGTGGHLNIAKVVAVRLNKLGVKPIYVGSTYGMDREWFSNSELFSRCYFQNTSGVMNKSRVGKVFALINILFKALLLFVVFKRHKITKVFSVGGYSSAPCAIASILLRKKLFIHEQNSVAGSINKILKPYSYRFYNSFTNPNDSYPTPKEMFTSSHIRSEVKTILFMGGSAGAHAINEYALKVAPKLKELNINIIHQTGKKELNEIQNGYKKLGIEATVFGFSSEIEKYIQKADLAVCRSGASSLWSLCANGLVALFVPYPYATYNHQKKNIDFLYEKGLCFYSDEKELTTKKLIDIVKNENLKEKSVGITKLIKPDGASVIAKEIVNS